MKHNMNTHKWIKGEFKIATNPHWQHNEPSDTRKGYTLSQVFGIANDTRNVTHIPTGYKLPGYFKRLRDAKAYAEALLPLTDWMTLTIDNGRERLDTVKSTITKLMQKHGI